MGQTALRYAGGSLRGGGCDRGGGGRDRRPPAPAGGVRYGDRGSPGDGAGGVARISASGTRGTPGRREADSTTATAHDSSTAAAPHHPRRRLALRAAARNRPGRDPGPAAGTRRYGGSGVEALTAPTAATPNMPGKREGPEATPIRSGACSFAGWRPAPPSTHHHRVRGGLQKAPHLRDNAAGRHRLGQVPIEPCLFGSLPVFRLGVGSQRDDGDTRRAFRRLQLAG